MSSELSAQVVQALLRRERLAQVGRLLRGVVHNLSGGLQMLRLPLDLLEMKLMQGQTQDLGSKLKAIQNGFERTNQETELLAAKAGQLMEKGPEPLDLCVLAREQLAFWRADMFFKHEAKVETDLPAQSAKVLASYQDVALAFNVLLTNAVEALSASSGRQLRVSWSQENGRSLLSLCDDAPAPDHELARTMFEAFVGDKGGEHDGLGLFLARAAISAWGGEVDWRAGPPKVFWLALPLITP